uniref:Uncharacterized protein n=1 Tax=Arundo donax TaxID=35708 RepID=A0A0A9AWF3_ARUDO
MLLSVDQTNLQFWATSTCSSW